MITILYLGYDCDEMSFPVCDKHYVTILEGNKGIMKYKEGLVNSKMYPIE
ncbi:hypothetical protein [Oceanirhabdus sp. W0125-5]|nr:hypothetical protein [Oceanirhabdus sp. W0125-5]WBW96409.1 hypothetical protein OW730_22345 [Oceanirhabdus sp. W0125-5]